MIKTSILKIEGNEQDHQKIKQAAQVLRQGGLVAFPTETVYGLGGNGLDAQAVDRIYQAKGRPSDNPMILHINHRKDLVPLVAEIPPIGEKIMAAYWPGPLTLIFNKSPKVPLRVTGGLDTVALRMPSHPVARELIQEAGFPIAAPSANLSGRPSPTKAEHVIQDLSGRVDIILVGDPSNIGLESTVLDLTSSTPMILRPGGITYEELREVVGEVTMDPGILEDIRADTKPRAPGMKYTHYAPKASMTIIQGDQEEVIKKIRSMAKEYQGQGKKVGILATQENLHRYPSRMVYSLGERDKPATIAVNLFALLRQCDEDQIEIILAEGIDGKGIGMAIINRMNKAAGHRIIWV